MVEQVVAELSSFRKAASQANEYVSQLFGGLLPSASKTNEASKELSATAKASSRNDDRIRTESNKAAAAASETADLGKQILNELKEFSKKFTTSINSEGGSFVDSIFGMGLGAAGITGVSALSGPFEDLSSEYTGEGGRPAEGFSGNLAKITTESGKSTWVAEEHAAKFQGFINDLQATGYKINDLGGYNYRANVNNPNYLSFHGLGAAIDINPAQNPNGTNKTDMPKETADLARKWGLGWGMSFQDPMHFSAAKFEGGSADIPRQKYSANSPFDINYKETGSVAGTGTNAPTNINQTETEDSENTGQATSSSEPQVTAASTTPPELPKSEATNNLPLVEASASARTDLKPESASGVESSVVNSPSLTKSQSSGIPTVSPAMANAGVVETVNFEPSKLELVVADLTPAPSYRTASLSGTNTSRQVVTPAVNYQAPKETTVASSGLPATRTPKQLNIKFDTNWISEANGKKQKTKETWMA
jgi:hypothetical protein